MEIYGCTEAGQVASRRPSTGIEWHTYDGIEITGSGGECVVQGGHVPQPTLLADVLEVLDSQTFRLLGRSNDLINVAGKRSSLSHLNYHLNSIPGIQDGAFWLPQEDTGGAVVRLIAFVVAPQLTAREVHDTVLASMRERVDAAFLPRRVVAVAALPREPGTGKLPAVAFAAWAQRASASASTATSPPPSP
jgi:acyl-coenzyme A synthetase/AMP-(fatty) acid ligase